MILLYILLVLIAVGVLLLSGVGKIILVITLLIGFLLLVPFIYRMLKDRVSDIQLPKFQKRSEKKPFEPKSHLFKWIMRYKKNI